MPIAMMPTNTAPPNIKVQREFPQPSLHMKGEGETPERGVAGGWNQDGKITHTLN